MSDSSKPEEEITLLPMVMLMSANESRMGRNKNKMARYSKEKLSASAVAKKWNRVKVRCVQKYILDVQFGLRMLSIFTESRDPSSSNSQFAGSGSLLSPPQGRSTHKQETNYHHIIHKYPSLPTLEYQASQSVVNGGTTPQSSRKGVQMPRRLKAKSDTKEGLIEDFEFSGVERQSRLFHNCMKGQVNESDDSASNRILERISAEKEKYRDSSSPLYQRKKLLKRELPKAEVMRDFVESYKERKYSADLNVASRKLSSHGNDLGNKGYTKVSLLHHLKWEVPYYIGESIVWDQK